MSSSKKDKKHVLIIIQLCQIEQTLNWSCYRFHPRMDYKIKTDYKNDGTSFDFANGTNLIWELQWRGMNNNKKESVKKDLHFSVFHTQNWYVTSEDLEYSVQVVWSVLL